MLFAECRGSLRCIIKSFTMEAGIWLYSCDFSFLSNINAPFGPPLCCNVLSKFLFGFVGFMGVQHPGLLVHRTPWSGSAVPGLDLWRASQLLLDDRFLQPAGLPDSHETGTHRIRLPVCSATAAEQSRWQRATFTHARQQKQTHFSFYDELQFILMLGGVAELKV